MEVRSYVVRVYVTRGYNMNIEEDADFKLKFKMGKQESEVEKFEANNADLK